MLYSTYQRVSVAIYVVSLGLLSLVVFSLSTALGIAFVLFFTLFGVISFWVHFSLMEDRLDEYGGRIPMPNAGLGIWGVDVVDDDYARPGEAGDDDQRSDYDTNELDQTPFAPKCPHCHAPLANSNAKFCSECGQPLSQST
jgi:hypothetical protein